MRRFLDLLLVAAFVGIIAAPPLANIAGVDGADPDAENRSLAPPPDAPTTWASARAFLPALDRWFTDHFAFRADLVQWFGVTRYMWLGVSPTPTVATARNGWLFYADDGGLEDFTNAYPLSDSELSVWRMAVWRAREWCAARGITYAFTIAPDKSSVYPEVFPQTARRVNRMSRTDQIFSAVSDTGAGIDLRPDLQREKRKARIFQKTDTHWNARGAHTAYTTIIDALRVRRPDIPPAEPLSAFNIVTKHAEGMDLAGMMGLRRVLGEQFVMLVRKTPRRYIVTEPVGNIAEAGVWRIVTEIPGSTYPRALVFRDSFMSAVAPFLSENFSRVVYVWRNDFSAADIEAEHPDVVLQEIVSRHAQYYVPSPELIPDP